MTVLGIATVAILVWGVAGLYKLYQREQEQLAAIVQAEQTQPDMVPQTDRQRLARADLERYKSQRETLLNLLDAIEAEISETTDRKRITALLSKQATTENKLFKVEHLIDCAMLECRY